MQFSALVLLPVFLQLIVGVSATTSGLMIIPTLVAVPITSVIAGQIMARTGRYRFILPGGFVLMSIAYILLARMAEGANSLEIECAAILLGCGIGCCGPVLITSTQNAARSSDIGAATSSLAFSRSLGATLGTALFWAILLVPLVSSAHGTSDALFHAGQAGIAQLPPSERLRVTTLLALGFRNVFVLGSCIAFGTTIFALFLKEEPLRTVARSSAASSAAAVLADQLE